MAIEIGKAAPDFTLPTDGGGEVSLSGLKGKNVIVYFYPKDDTPGCTKEACGFRDALPDFSKKIDADGHRRLQGQRRQARQVQGQARAELHPRLGRGRLSVCEAYGTWVEKSMYGKKYMGIDRSTVLIDKDGVVRAHWKKVKVPGHVDAVLKATQEL